MVTAVCVASPIVPVVVVVVVVPAIIDTSHKQHQEMGQHRSKFCMTHAHLQEMRAEGQHAPIKDATSLHTHSKQLTCESRDLTHMPGVVAVEPVIGTGTGVVVLVVVVVESGADQDAASMCTHTRTRTHTAKR